MAESDSDDSGSSMPDLQEQEVSDDEEVMTLEQLRQSVRTQLRESQQLVRTGGITTALENADRARTEGNDVIRTDPAQAARKYEDAMAQLWPFESRPDAAWPLILCLSNHATAALQQEQYDKAIDSCDDGLALLARHGHGLASATQRADKEQKLQRNKARAMQVLAEKHTRDEEQAAAAAAADEAAARRAAEQAAAAAAAQARAEADAAEAREQQRKREEEERAAAAQRAAERAAERAAAAAERKAAEQARAEQEAATKAVAEEQRRVVEQARAAQRAAEEQAELDRRAAAARIENERRVAAQAREAAEREAREAAREAERRRREETQAARRQRREVREAQRLAHLRGEQERAEMERAAALQRAEWADRQNRERAAQAARDVQERDEAAIAMQISRSTAREEHARQQYEAAQLERAMAESLRLSAGGAAPAAPAPLPAPPEELEKDAVCSVCLEGPEDGNDCPVHRPCSTCIISMHLGCAARWRTAERNAGRPLTCPGCRAEWD